MIRLPGWDNGNGAVVPFAVFALAAIVVELSGAGSLLRYERDLIGDGELWRLLTASAVHLGPTHLALNITGLVLVGWLTGAEYRAGHWSAIALIAALSVTASLYLLHPSVRWYVGLSGMLHGLLAAGLLPGIARREPESLMVAALLLGKLSWEAVYGPLPGSEQSAGGPVLVAAHRYGALGGAIGGFAILVWERRGRSV